MPRRKQRRKKSSSSAGASGIVIGFLLFIGVLIGGGILTGKIPISLKWLKKDGSTPVADSERHKMHQDWMEAGRRYADRSGSARAKRIATMLEERGVAAIPRPFPEVVELMDSPPNTAWIAMVSVMPEDKFVDSQWEGVFKEGFLAFATREGMRDLIVLKYHDKYGAEGKAIVLLHEGSHVLDPPHSDSVAESARSERRAQETGIDVYRGIGGEPYEVLAKRAAQQLLLVLQKQGLEVLMEANPEVNGLDTIFGKPETKLDSALRYSSFATYARLLAIEEQYPDDAERIKDEMFLIYKNKNQVSVWGH